MYLPSFEIVSGSQPHQKTIFFLHGILGSRRNWLSFARQLIEKAPHWRAVLIDLRHHGESHGAPPPDDLRACAQDVAQVAATLGAEPAVVIGHSFGGKVALMYAQEQATDLEELWVIDAPPGLRESRSRGDVESVFQVIGELPLPIPGRRELVDTLTARGLSVEVARWMTTNLRPAPGGVGFVWRFDLEAATRMLRAYGAYDAWPVLEAPPSGVRPVLVRGGRSDRWLGDDLQRLSALAAADRIGYHVIEDAGHWLHTESPERLQQLLAPTLSAP
ncbi:MAG: alpha/beta fold hydrolase [Myxococcota bacterium]